MTMDDGNSVYVGGLPYDITEEAVRRVFSIYGSVLTVKIVNDRSVRGKCYGFVTFSNRRSVDDAIDDMDGKNIGGRAVRVNEVTTRGGRMNPGPGRVRPHGGWDRSPDRRSDGNYDRDRYSDRSRERDRSQDRRKDQHYIEKERAYEHSLEFERRNDHDMLDRNGYKERVFEGDGGDWRGDRSFGDNGRGIKINGTSTHEGRSQETKRDDSTMLDGRGKDHFSNTSGDQSFQVKGELDSLIKIREALQDEVLVVEDRLEEKEVVCSELQKKSKRLEDLLINEKKLVSQRRKELAKLHKSFSRVRECTDNLKDCEQELQSLVNAAARDGVAGGDEGLGNVYA
ncbi:PREDICTED: glycine-rich RNA-binding protein RZ1B isoform X2 [Camelina sativa]|uniref:Glycine-rich RNA-binding protein RZ1B isoform X2 n=1 Tax=Camelina sativa TaxID=90675 RepID=A0ABM0T4M9_CAMSA|nr:PREDICTED: glycine-rich RNA-binding protein RZ1B isoform X2 [Camelina sativa]